MQFRFQLISDFVQFQSLQFLQMLDFCLECSDHLLESTTLQFVLCFGGFEIPFLIFQCFLEFADLRFVQIFGVAVSRSDALNAAGHILLVLEFELL